jgi:Mg2+/Co2+ transporter CorB
MIETSLILTLGAIFVLLILSAFFSGTETALTGSSKHVMHQLEKTGNSQAKLVNRLHEQKARLIGTILIGNNLINILASALATSLLIAAFGEAGIAYATIIMTILIVMFAEILPKTYALQNTDRVALKVAPFIRPITLLFSPFTEATSFITRITFLVFGIKLHNKDGFVSRTEELRGAIELHKGEHETVKGERAMLRSVLDLAEVEVGAIMVHRKTVTMINADDPPEEIVSQVLACPYTRLPLWRKDPDNIVGILHAKELLRALQEKPGKTTELNIPNLSSDPWFIPETTHLLDQLQAFRERHEHFALVVDEYGSLMGVVTLEDILEEIVGDISDEHDISASGLRRQADGTFIVEGKFTIRDLNRQLDWNLPDEEAATVAGLILHESRRIPEEGQTFLFYGIRFEVLRRQRNQITAVRVAQQQN